MNITEAVCKRIDVLAMNAVEEVLDRGRAQIVQQATMCKQIAETTANYRRLQKENATLRAGLEAVVRHVEMLSRGIHPAMLAGGFPPCSSKAAAPCRPMDRTFWPIQEVVGEEEEDEAEKVDAMAVASTEEGGLHAEQQQHHSASDLATEVEARLQDIEDARLLAEAASAHELEVAGLFPKVPALAELHGTVASAGPSQLPGQTKTQELSPVKTSSTMSQNSPATPVSRKQPSTPTSASTTMTPTEAEECFVVTMRRLEGKPFGLQVDPELQHLRVRSIVTGSLAEAWNKQVEPRRRLLPGDRIIKVNDAEEPSSMRNEFSTQLLLRLEVLRDVLSPSISDAGTSVPPCCDFPAPPGNFSSPTKPQGKGRAQRA